MILYDKLYGEFEVDKVIEELILSEPVQRLKGFIKVEQVTWLMKNGMKHVLTTQ